MNTEPLSKCPQCGAALPVEAPAGLCPRCLMALNLKTETAFSGESAAAQPPLPPEQIAPHFPQLEIIEFLGRGGMGVVYRARQKTLNRFVALKLLAPERVGDPKFAERFAREAQALAALNHPNIVTIHDFGQAGGFYFLIMEYVDGANLRHLLRARRFTPEEALAIVPTLCDALQFAHERGIVHRDMKPENILLDKSGRVKVADFGIAKMLGNGGADAGGDAVSADNATQNAMGTPGYIAPEQQSDPRRVDSRADIYSLGVVFYEMLTGELPGRKIEPPSHKVQIDVRLDEIVLRALEQKPELRYQQASVLKTQVETIVQSGPRPGGESPPPHWAGYEYKSKRTLFGLPLLHVATGFDPQTGQARKARGIVAVGAIASGVLAMGGRAYGVVAFGGLTVGVISMGGLALGVFAFGGLAVGMVALGGLSLALVFALGGGAIGPVAVGGLAVGYFAVGALALGANVLDPSHGGREWLAMIQSNGRQTLVWLQAGGLIIWVAFLASYFVILGWAKRRSLQAVPAGGNQPGADQGDRSRGGAQPGGSDKLTALVWFASVVATGLILLVAAAVAHLMRAQIDSHYPSSNSAYGVSFGDEAASRRAAAKAAHATPNRVRQLSGAPFTAQLPAGGSVELLAVHLWPATNSPWWQLDGLPTAYSTNIVPSSSDGIGDGAIALVRMVWPRSHERWPHREPVTDEPDPALATGLWLANQDGRTYPMDELAVMPFAQALPRGEETTLRLNVATAPWQTLMVVQPGLSGALFAGGPARREWHISEAADGSLTVRVSHLVESLDMQYRLVAVDKDGMEYLPSRSETKKVSTENFVTREYTFGLVPGDSGSVRIAPGRLREVRWQTRSYETVEFRHVSLAPGHHTMVEIKDFGLEPATAERQETAGTNGEMARLAFGPAVERVLPMDDKGLTDLFDPGTGLLSESQSPPDFVQRPTMLSEPGLVISRDRQMDDTVLLGMNGVVPQAVAGEQWESLTDVDALARLGKAPTNLNVTVVATVRGDPVQTFLFRLNTGKIGMMQVVAFTENPRNVKIRYKLAR